jgi:hypothetical protein
MEHTFNHEQLPSGKVIIRHFDGEGALVEETHAYGTLDVAIKYDFRAGTKVDESYFAKRRMVSRRTYEKARAAYEDMPVADASLEDSGAALLRAAATEQRERRLEAKRHQLDPDKARRLDAFCSSLLKKGKTEDAATWIGKKKHTLGEQNWGSSKRLVGRLVALGCVRIHACQIDVYEDGCENTGHLVIELPMEPEVRSKILKAIDRLASELGYSGDFDDGQRYAYVKLD